MTSDGIRRRQAIAGAVTLGATPLLAGCGGDDNQATEGSPGERSSGPIPTSDVPVGGGVVLDGQKVVVTQPTEGDFKAFSAVCTHQGCTVGKIEKGVVVCPCHGSQFSIEDGSVANGPASAPLEEVSVKVQGDEITVG